jgi:formylglycine-generating enzyme required for sulfatase activity
MPDTRRRTMTLLAAAAMETLTIAVVFSACAAPPRRGAVRQSPIDGLPYVWIPDGGFREGCSAFDANCGPEEKPAHDVTISKGFWIGQTEVTVGAFRRFAGSRALSLPPEPTFGDRSLNPGWNEPDLPIVNVTWDEAKSYCGWAGGYLPTEAQWEYAARAGSAAAQSSDLRGIAWFADNTGQTPLDATVLAKQDPGGFLGRLSLNRNGFRRVGMLAPNDVGLRDTLGNVWEWTADWFGENYADNSDRFDPAGRPKGVEKVLRGGSWTNAREVVRVSVRGRRPPESRSVDTGFRCAQ